MCVHLCRYVSLCAHVCVWYRVWYKRKVLPFLCKTMLWIGSGLPEMIIEHHRLGLPAWCELQFDVHANACRFQPAQVAWSQRVTSFWRPLDSHQCCLSAERAVCRNGLVSLWPAWLAMSFEGFVQSWPCKREWYCCVSGHVSPWGHWSQSLPSEELDGEGSRNQILWLKGLDCLVQKKGHSGWWRAKGILLQSLRVPWVCQVGGLRKHCLSPLSGS